MKYICKRDAETWSMAPFPYGGEYRLVEADSFVGLVIDDAKDSVSDAAYVVVDEDALSASPVAIVDGKRGRKFSKTTLSFKAANLTAELKVGDWQDKQAGQSGLEQSELQSMQTASGIQLGISSSGEAVWLTDGGLSAWRENRIREQAQREAAAHRRRQEQLKKEKEEQDRREAEAERQRQEQLNRLYGAEKVFVNPYTFVPLPEKVDRGKPRWHSSLSADTSGISDDLLQNYSSQNEAGLSGKFTWQLTFKTPLVLPLDQAPQLMNGKLLYPGSSLRGALRSIHETLTNSCMRILDSSYLPVHREPMNVDTKNYHLAVVHKVENDAVTELELCSDECWISSDCLPQSKSGIQSGSPINFDASKATYKSQLNRRELPQKEKVTVDPTSNWVMHLTDPGARNRDKGYFFAAGRLSGKIIKLDVSVWEDFRRVCEGGGDLIGVPARQDTLANRPQNPQFVQVVFGDRLIGMRRKVDGWLYPGDTVWVEIDHVGGSQREEKIVRLKMATIWRAFGKLPVRERMAESCLPCSDDDYLCRSCQVFGSVDPEGDTEKKQQVGYASHIKVSWGESAGSVDVQLKQLPPLRAPKPSSGNFYLVTAKKSDLASVWSARKRSIDEDTIYDANDHVIRSHWGSSLDQADARQIRGRKYYWHGDDKGRREKYKDVAERTERSTVSGIVLRAKVTFDNLSPVQLGWLLGAANPNLLLSPQEGGYCLHFGGGKPLGYGSAAPEILNLEVYTAQSRYGRDSESDENSSAIAARTAKYYCDLALTSVRARDNKDQQNSGKILPEFSQTFVALERVLSMKPEGVDVGRISYPPGVGGDATFNRDDTRFYESFRWFQQHTGAQNGDMTPLPLLVNLQDEKKLVSQYVPIPPDSWIGKDEQKRIRDDEKKIRADQYYRGKGGR